MKQAKQLRSLAPAELQGKIYELRKELMKERAQVARGAPPKNPGKIRQAKKSIARIFTILTEKEREKARQEAKSNKPKSKNKK